MRCVAKVYKPFLSGVDPRSDPVSEPRRILDPGRVGLGASTSPASALMAMRLVDWLRRPRETSCTLDSIPALAVPAWIGAPESDSQTYAEAPDSDPETYAEATMWSCSFPLLVQVCPPALPASTKV